MTNAEIKADSKWEEMTNHQRNIWLAQFVIGFRRVKQKRQTCSGQDECWQLPGSKFAFDSDCVCHNTPNYTGDIEAAFDLQGELLRQCFDDLYVERLWEVVYGRTVEESLGRDDASDIFSSRGFKLVHATAEQRAEAAYRTRCRAVAALAAEGRL